MMQINNEAYNWGYGTTYRRPIKKIVKNSQWKDSEPVNNVTEFDANGRETYNKIGTYEEWTTYDSSGRITEYKNTSGGGYTAQYDQEGNLLKLVRENGYIEEYEYEYAPHVVNIPSIWPATYTDNNGIQVTLTTTDSLGFK